MENGVQYEIINKANGESFLATEVAFGEGEVTVRTVAFEVVFKNDNGVWSNDEWVARDAETKLAPNGVDVVEDIVPSVPVSDSETATEAAPEVAPEVVG